MANIKKGDLVQVITGPTQDRGGDRGKQGRVIEVQVEKNRVIVEGVNFVTKHVKVGQTQRGTKTGGIETHESPDPHLERRARRPEDQEADPRRLPRRGRREERRQEDRARALREEVRREALMSNTAVAGKIQPRLKQKYRAEIIPALTEEFGYTNPHQVPGLVKVVVNTGVGEAARDSKVIDGAIKDLTLITGQKPQVTKARKSIAQFKLREGMPIGAHVTLRGDRAWEFLDRLVTLALPRIRDFRGLSPEQFDGNGNYTFGVAEQSIFHEINQDQIDRVRGFDITVVTTAKTDDEGRALLRAFGFPFQSTEK